MSDDVRYEESDSLAILTLNRPDKLNTLTEAMVQGVADGIDRATAREFANCGPVAYQNSDPTVSGIFELWLEIEAP